MDEEKERKRRSSAEKGRGVENQQSTVANQKKKTSTVLGTSKVGPSA